MWKRLICLYNYECIDGWSKWYSVTDITMKRLIHNRPRSVISVASQFRYLWVSSVNLELDETSERITKTRHRLTVMLTKNQRRISLTYWLKKMQPEMSDCGLKLINSLDAKERTNLRVWVMYSKTHHEYIYFGQACDRTVNSRILCFRFLKSYSTS